MDSPGLIMSDVLPDATVLIIQARDRHQHESTLACDRQRPLFMITVQYLSVVEMGASPTSRNSE